MSDPFFDTCILVDWLKGTVLAEGKIARQDLEQLVLTDVFPDNAATHASPGCAEAGALATETRLELVEEGGIVEILPNNSLTEITMRNLRELNDMTYSEAEIEFGIYYAISDNPNRRWDLTNTMLELGYRPEDSWDETLHEEEQVVEGGKPADPDWPDAD